MLSTSLAYGAARHDTWNSNRFAHDSSGYAEEAPGRGRPAAVSSNPRYNDPMHSSSVGTTAPGQAGWYNPTRALLLDWTCQAPLLQLFVALADGPTVMVEAEATHTIGQLKQIIHAKRAAFSPRTVQAMERRSDGRGAQGLASAGPQQMMLACRTAGKLVPLENGQTLVECKLQSHMTIQQIRAPPEPEPEPEPEQEPEGDETDDDAEAFFATTDEEEPEAKEEKVSSQAVYRCL